jgi:hypothetical protein
LKYEVDHLEKRITEKSESFLVAPDVGVKNSRRLEGTSKIDEKLKAYVEKLIKKCDHLEARYNFYKELVEQKEFMGGHISFS